MNIDPRAHTATLHIADTPPLSGTVQCLVTDTVTTTIAEQLSHAVALDIHHITDDVDTSDTCLVLLSGTNEAAIDAVVELAHSRLARHRRSPWWIILVNPTPETITDIDARVDSASYPPDAIIAIASTEAAAVHVEAWLRLRHAAPRALANLRDGRGSSCRIASIAAIQLPLPPTIAPEDDNSRSSHAELLVEQWRQSLEKEWREHAEKVLVAAASAEVGTYAQKLPEIFEQLMGDDVSSLELSIPQRPAPLAAAIASIGDTDAPPSPQSVADQPETLAAVAADAAIASEVARTGFAARFGKKKRLAELSADRTAAYQAWATATEKRFVLSRWNEVARATKARLSEELANARQQESEERIAKQQHATLGWLQRAQESTHQLRPPFELNREKLDSAWGIAAPEPRYTVLLPTAAFEDVTYYPEESIDLDTDDVHAVRVLTMEGLTRPLGICLLMGMPASAVLRR